MQTDCSQGLILPLLKLAEVIHQLQCDCDIGSLTVGFEKNFFIKRFEYENF